MAWSNLLSQKKRRPPEQYSGSSYDNNDGICSWATEARCSSTASSSCTSPSSSSFSWFSMVPPSDASPIRVKLLALSVDIILFDERVEPPSGRAPTSAAAPPPSWLSVCLLGVTVTSGAAMDLSDSDSDMRDPPMSSWMVTRSSTLNEVSSFRGWLHR
ncbi:hypothetical protein CRUP_000232 [Coryphaenoides rupestris]|nr:hypothetical protein CRUP_000232 [Coryphaenoides rupestris]